MTITPRQWLQQRALVKASTAVDPATAVAVMNVLVNAVTTDEEDWMDDMASRNERRELSQSQLYIMQLIEIAWQNSTTRQEQPQVPDNNGVVTVPAPTILLDEWLDKETPTVVRAVQRALQRLVQRTGAIVVCATHVSERFDLAGCRRVRLQSGRLVEPMGSI